MGVSSNMVPQPGPMLHFHVSGSECKPSFTAYMQRSNGSVNIMYKWHDLDRGPLQIEAPNYLNNPPVDRE